MYALAKLSNWILVILAIILAIFMGELPWLLIVAGVVLALATPINYVLGKKLLQDRQLSIKASTRQFARRYLEKATYWLAIGATVVAWGIIRTVEFSMTKAVNPWIKFIPVVVFIVGWIIAGKNSIDPDKYDLHEEEKAQ